MRIAVIADTHLGYKYGTERGEDAFRNAALAFQKAESYNLDLILLLGDIFDHRVAKPEVLSRAMALFKSLRTDVVSIYGTHETRHKDAVNPVQLLVQAGLLKCLHKESISLEKNGQRIGIHGMSGVHDTFAKEELRDWNPQPIPDTFNILLLHQTFKEDVPVLKNILSYSDLPAFNLYLFGHIHDAKERSLGGGAVLYPGSTVRTQLAKQILPLGFYMLEITNNQLKKEFVTIPTREYFHISIPIDNYSPAEVIGILVTKIESVLGNKPLIKVKLTGKLKEGFTPSDLQLSPVFRRFKDSCFLKIDKDLESEQTEKRLNFLANLGREQKSIEMYGMDLLCSRLGGDKTKIVKLFECLSDGRLEDAEELLK